MTSDKPLGGTDAFALFPELMRGMAGRRPTEGTGVERTSPAGAEEEVRPPGARAQIAPPPPPDISWLHNGEYMVKGEAPTERTALIVMADDGARSKAVKACEALGYRIEMAGRGDDAIKKVTAFDAISLIVADTGFMSDRQEESPFHLFMKWLPMSRRRFIHYTVIGPRFHTLSGLEALAESANLVVNAADIEHIDVILRKGLAEYEGLFLPYINVLGGHQPN